MIIDKMTLRTKNIIFFKLVTFCLCFIAIFYIISHLNENLDDTKIQKMQVEELLNKASSRLNALKSDKSHLEKIFKKYNELVETKNNPYECFNRNAYSKEVKKIEKKLGLKDQIRFMTSTNYEGNNSSNTILMRVSKVRLNYLTSDFLTAVKIAKNAYEALPNYNFVNSFEIKRNKVLTPKMLQLLKTSNEADLISSNLQMEVKELELKGL